MLRRLRNPRLLPTFAVGFNVLFSLVGIFTYITLYLAAPPFRLSTEKLSYLFVVVYLIGLVATPAAGHPIARVGLRAGVAGAIVVSLLGVLLTPSHSLAVVIGGLALLCTGVFISQPSATSYLHEVAPVDGRISAAGLCLSITRAGQLPEWCRVICGRLGSGLFA